MQYLNQLKTATLSHPSEAALDFGTASAAAIFLPSHQQCDIEIAQPQNLMYMRIT
jgi:hypothetical protein